MSIDQLWATPVATYHQPLPLEVAQQLVALIVRRDAQKDKAQGGGTAFKQYVDSGRFYHSIHYNLFDLPETTPEHDALRVFEQHACRAIRQYLRDGFAAHDAQTVELSARCFGHVHTPGAKTFPHYHQASDLVLVHYLRLGGNNAGEPLSLIMQDPRGAPNYPWWGKMHTINPVEGMTVCHPSFLWHETNEWHGAGNRVLIAANFKVIGHGHEKQFKTTNF